MKKLTGLFILLPFMAIVFSSCAKKNDNQTVSISSFMKFDSNGASTSFNTCFAIATNLDTIKKIIITGYTISNNQPGASNVTIVLVQDITTLKTGQTFPAEASVNQSGSSTILFAADASNTFTTQPKNPQGTVTITAITSTSISGTFSGKLFAQNDLDGRAVIYTITNGSFTAGI